MATSGNYTLALTVNDAAQKAFKLLQSTGDGEPLTGQMISDFKSSGNLLLKEWQSQGLHLWTNLEGTLFLTNGQSKYDFRLSTTKVSNAWFETTTTAATVAGVYTFNVTSAANIQSGDTIGIIQNDNDLFWTTVTFVNSLAVTVTDPVTLATVSGAAVRNYRDTFTPVSRIVPRGIRRKDSTESEVPIIDSTRDQYFNLPSKDTTGTPVQAYYDRQDVAGEKYGVMYLWVSPSSCVPVINFTYERKMQIMTAADETIDVPESAQKALIYSVAEDLIPEYGCSLERAALIVGKAKTLREDMLTFDSQSHPIKIKMRRRG